jgi:hypothetical protein
VLAARTNAPSQLRTLLGLGNSTASPTPASPTPASTEALALKLDYGFISAMKLSRAN